MEINDLENMAKVVRRHVVTMAHTAPSSHVASALSCVDILVSLFFDTLTYDDRFILSKGHGCMAYYATLAEKGYFSREWLTTYSKNGSPFAEHPPSQDIPGIEVATGALGHGLSISLGAALGRKIVKKPGKEYVLLGDGECNEGSVWEAAMLAGNMKLDNLVAIIDNNKMQANGFVDDMPMLQKWQSFGWTGFSINGHFFESLKYVFDPRWEHKGPLVVVANTIKGKGVSFMENDLLWHYRPPNKEELEKALEELK